MIAKHIKPKNKQHVKGSYPRLANYIADAPKKDEKRELLWAVNCNFGDGIEDLECIIAEVEATQNLNTRAKSNKTYHLLVSFRDEKPSAEAMIDIEKQIAEALGFQDHQRIAATHKNTENYHMHVAYNKIHPKTRKIHHPKHDYMALERACRSLEAQYGLKVDKGRGEGSERNLKSGPARDMEAHTWEQSFTGYVKERLQELEEGRINARSWQDLHRTFKEYGLLLRPRGNGLIITDANHQSRTMKASTLSRNFSKDSLEKQLGKFEPSRQEDIKAKQSYEKRPITRHRDQIRLWKIYRVGLSDLASKAAYRNWRQFLQMEAPNDPLARAIIKAQNQLIQGTTRSRSPSLGR
ncbi:MAG: TraI/MobA(P) family conjugative relaxase [Parvularculales bacterium]